MTREDFGLWKEHPVTEALFAQLRERLDQRREDLVNASLENVAILQGEARVLADILMIEYQDIAQDD